MIPIQSGALLISATATVPSVTVPMLVVFAIILCAFILFVTELIPIDITALGVVVALVVLEPWTFIDARTGISGFSNPATITVLAMFILSEGVRRTGFIQWVGNKIISIASGNPLKQFAMLVGLSGSTAGMLNNTPVVAMMIPMATDIAEKTKTSPSKYLMPISFAAMMGGTLTLIGTSTNLLASDVSERLIGHSFSMFEFTLLGVIVLVVGLLYLIFIGRHLIPERIKPEEELTEEFDMQDYLTEVTVRENSPLTGYTVREAVRHLDVDADIIHLVRDGTKFSQPLARKEILAGDRLMIRTDRENLLRLADIEALDIVSPTGLEEARSGDPQRSPRRLAEVVLLPDTAHVGETIASLNFEERHEATVLAIRRGPRVFHEYINDFKLAGGDTLLVLASPKTFQHLSDDRRYVVVEEEARPDVRTKKVPVALGIVAAVIGLAATGVFPILITALAGILAMVVTGCLKPTEVYDAVDWPVIFLLAGMIPLGTALEASGGASYLAALIVSNADMLGPLAMLFVFYCVTAIFTQIVSNNAAVVLMIPVAVDGANIIGAAPFSFILAVTFAASTAMLTPIGYQTNLMVYAPGGYKFTDFFRVGAPLQLILAITTAVGIYFLWGV